MNEIDRFKLDLAGRLFQAMLTIEGVAPHQPDELKKSAKLACDQAEYLYQAAAEKWTLPAQK